MLHKCKTVFRSCIYVFHVYYGKRNHLFVQGYYFNLLQIEFFRLLLEILKKAVPIQYNILDLGIEPV